MEIKDFIRTQVALFQIGTQISSLDLTGFLQMIEEAKKKSPSTATPEQIAKGQANMEELRKLGEGAMPLQAAFKYFSEKVVAAGVASDAGPEQVADKKVDEEKTNSN